MSSRLSAVVVSATVSLGAAAAMTSASAGGYVAGDMHNHNTCTDGSVAAGYTIDRSVGTGTDAAGGNNFNLDWFTLGNHGGSGNRDCRFADPSSKLVTTANPTWSQTLGQTIQGITIAKLKGDQPAGAPTSKSQMWRWQNIQELEYPILNSRSAQYKKVLIEGLEQITPGHEHVDVAIVSGQRALTVGGNANAMAEYEYRFDRADGDKTGPVDGNGNQIWIGKDAVNNSGTAGHTKAVRGVTWLQQNYPLTSYFIPTHTERKGPFDPNSSAGFNIESFRDFNNAGPTVAFGIESPGHAAQGSKTGGAGSYEPNAVGAGTYGLVGIYHAKIGGLWDGLLAEGRNSFMYISSDWHQRGTFGANEAGTTSDFLPGEFSKLYLPTAAKTASTNIISAMRSGNSYSVLGDLIGSNFVFTAQNCTPTCGPVVTMGQTLVAKPGDTITVRMNFTMPMKNNSPYSFPNPLLAQVGLIQPLNAPVVDHVDLITSPITGLVAPGSANYAVTNAGGTAGAAIVYNANAKLAKQIALKNMTRTKNADGSVTAQFQTNFTMGSSSFYIRARGTNVPVNTPNVTDATGTPLLDTNNASVICADPACPAQLDTDASGNKLTTYDVQAYSNLWFYANPIFVRLQGAAPLAVEAAAAKAAQIASGK